MVSGRGRAQGLPLLGRGGGGFDLVVDRVVFMDIYLPGQFKRFPKGCAICPDARRTMGEDR